MVVKSEPQFSRQNGERYVSISTYLTLGSIGNLSSAAAVAVSSFEMKVRDPQPFLDKIDWNKYDKMRAQGGKIPTTSFEYSEPSPIPNLQPLPVALFSAECSSLPAIVTGKVQRFGDNIDTDAVSSF